jgi:Holliday junction resolvase-like predicted endonuclease
MVIHWCFCGRAVAMKCPDCQADNPDGVKFCGQCGQLLHAELTCPSCSHRNPGDVKFCHNCGVPLALERQELQVSNNIDGVGPETSSEGVAKVIDTDTDENQQYGQRRGAYELGVALEDTVEDILKAEGYSTQRRARLRGEKGVSEIDIVARRGTKEVIAVECKNYSSPVPVKEVRDFINKLEDLKIKNGLFAACPDFSGEAARWGQNYGLELWGEDVLREKYFEIKIGRLGTKELGKLECYLPLKVDYDGAVNLDFENKEKVEIESAKLIWKPFYKVSFRIKCVRTDPSKQKHTIEDSGYYIVDGLSGNIVEHSDAVKKFLKKMLGQSEKETHQIRETDVFFKELGQEPAIDLDLKQSQLYKTIIYKPLGTEERARRIVIDGIIEDYAETVTYELKKDEDDLFAPEREFTIVPSYRDIKIIDLELIHVPKWEIEFRSKEHKYTRKITGNSGTIVYDTVTNCNKHWFSGLSKKRNMAVCDVCGAALCKEHIWKCPTCDSWRCETHSKTCISCQKRYCPEHISNKCIECGNAVCDSCAIKCPICEEIHCRRHVTKCSKCGRTVCVSCTRKEGGILSFRQKVYCRDC